MMSKDFIEFLTDCMISQICIRSRGNYLKYGKKEKKTKQKTCELMCEKISQYMNTCLSMICILKKKVCSGKITKAIDLSHANINYFVATIGGTRKLRFESHNNEFFSV